MQAAAGFAPPGGRWDSSGARSEDVRLFGFGATPGGSRGGGGSSGLSGIPPGNAEEGRGEERGKGEP